MDRKSYLPPIWSDDVQMAGLMSMIKTREVNPYDHDRKIKFWSELIARSCAAECDPLVTVDKLKRRFRRGDQLPGSMDTVIEHMHRSGELIRFDEFKQRDQSWLQWGYTRFVDVIWGAPTAAERNNTEYIHVPSLREKARQIVEYYRANHASEDDLSLEIIAMDEFRNECRHLIPNGRVFQLVLSELVHQNELTIGVSKTGEEILKFRDAEIRGPVEWTESDSSVHDMRRAMSKLENEIKRLEEKAKRADQDARASIRSNDRQKAAHFLRLKKRTQQEIESKDNQYQRLLEMMHQLGQTKQNRQIMDAYRAGANAFKATLQRQGIKPEQIDETLDSISDAMATAEEIREAISSGISPPAGAIFDESELEAELENILAETKPEAKGDEVLEGLPQVPSEGLEPSPAKSSSSVESLAQRLKRLRESAS